MPRDWSAWPSGDFMGFLADMFTKYIAEVSGLTGSDPLSSDIQSHKRDIQHLANQIHACVEAAFLGHQEQASQALDQGLGGVLTQIEMLRSKKQSTDDLGKLYRLRDWKKKRPPQKEDLFHIPFQDRSGVSLQRYGFPGVPCLYMGGSVFVCQEELRLKGLTTAVAIKAEMQDTASTKFVSLAYPPGLVSHLVEDVAFDVQHGTAPIMHDLALAHAICWPLFAATSISVRKPTHPFKPEYVVPQLLLQWVLENPDFHGVRYFTTRPRRWSGPPRFPVNYVFPAQSLATTGHCSHLKSLFMLTQPMNLVSAQSMASKGNLPTPPYPAAIWSGQPLVRGAHLDYWATDAGLLELSLLNLSATPL